MFHKLQAVIKNAVDAVSIMKSFEPGSTITESEPIHQQFV